MSKNPSALEQIKSDSRLLRGTIAEGLADSLTGSICEDDTKLLKFHGSYQQDDRDVRDLRRRQKLEPDFGFMVRVRLPGGVLSPPQWLALDELACRHASGDLRITTRQTFQYHGVSKQHLRVAIAAIHAIGLSTLAACGDVNRNVVTSVNPMLSSAHAEVHAWANRIAEHLSPQTGAYRELWLDDGTTSSEAWKHESEPLYGPTYLPRKFKIGIAIPPCNDIDVYSQDLGLIAVIDDGALHGFNLTAGGGMGATAGDSSTYPQLGDPIGFVAPDRILDACWHAIAIQRDYGNRSERKLARLKYTIDRRSLDWYRTELESRLDRSLEAPRPYRFAHNGDRHGWVEGDGGQHHLTLHIPSGRLRDEPEHARQSGMREIARIHQGEFRMTCNQNVIVANVAANERGRIESLVAEHGLDDHNRASPLRRNALACVALPTCGLAMAEGERYLPRILTLIEDLLVQRGLADEPIHFRISGCANGCSRPYLGEIALVGRAVGRYDLRLGADAAGERLNALFRENIDEKTILVELDLLFARFAGERDGDERFGDFLVRAGVVAPPARRPALAYQR